MKLSMNKNQRMLWSDKLMDLANYSVAGLVFGSFIGAKNIEELRMDLMISGIILYFVFAGTAHVLRR